MADRRGLVIGAGRIAGGFVAPLLRAHGWRVTMVCRSPDVRAAIEAHGRVHIRYVDGPDRAAIDGITAMSIDDPALERAVIDADLVGTALGPASLCDAGRRLGPLIEARLAHRDAPLNLITFENHRRSAETITLGLLETAPGLSAAIGSRLGVAGAAVWRTVSRRDLTDDGLRFTATRTKQCHVDAMSMVAGAAPLDDGMCGFDAVSAFDDRMVEKLWLFNAGHAATAYLGWQAGCATVADALDRPEIEAITRGVVVEAQHGFAAYRRGRPGSVDVPPRSVDDIVAHYANRQLDDPVVRVAREPRRKLASDDRLIGPALACLTAGIEPDSLAHVIAAALNYADRSDTQAVDLQREIALVGATEVLASVATLDPNDRLVELVMKHRAAMSPAATA